MEDHHESESEDDNDNDRNDNQNNIPLTSEDAERQSEKTAHYFVFSGDNKAGMHGYEKKKQAQIIYEMSKESSFFKQAEKQDEKRKIKICDTKKKVDQYLASKSNKSSNGSGLYPGGGGGGGNNSIMKMVDSYTSEYEARRDVSSIKVVVDMDMFFAAVAIRDRPHLKDQPVAIGGMSMISTSNYVARTYGVRSAMPGFIAKKLCPHLIFIGHESSKYQEASRVVKDIMREYDPQLQSHSLDEFFLDITAYTDKEICRRQEETRNSKKNHQNDNNNDSNNNNNCDGVALIDQKIGSHGGESHSHSHSEDAGCTSRSSSISLSLKRKARDVEFETALDENDEDDEEKDEDGDEDESLCTSTASSAVATCTLPPALSPEHRRRVACEIVAQMRQRVCVATGGLTCSAGIANNSFLAKIGADQNKPDGQFSLSPSREAVLEFLDDLPCRKIPGIGRVTENMLSELGLKTMGAVRRRRDEVLVAFTPKQGRFLVRVSLGIDSREGGGGGEPEGEGEGEGGDQNQAELQKSIGSERTFQSISAHSLLLEKLSGICQQVHEDLLKRDIFGSTVTLKIKTSGFRLFTRSCTVTPRYSPGIFFAADIFKVAKQLLLTFLATCSEEEAGERGGDSGISSGSGSGSGSDGLAECEGEGVAEVAAIKNSKQSATARGDRRNPFPAAPAPVPATTTVPAAGTSTSTNTYPIAGSPRSRSAPRVSIRLMGVQISKLGRFKPAGAGSGERGSSSIRESKVCQMLLSAPPAPPLQHHHVPPPAASVASIPSCDNDPLLKSVHINNNDNDGISHVKVARQTTPSSRVTGATSAPVMPVSVSVLDMMYGHPDARVSLLHSDAPPQGEEEEEEEDGHFHDSIFHHHHHPAAAAAASSTSTFSSISMSTNRQQDSSSSSSSMIFSSDYNDNNDNNSANSTDYDYWYEGPVNNRDTQTFLSEKRMVGGTIFPASSDHNTTKQSSPPSVENVSCPICDYKCKTLFHLNIHLDRNCEESNDSIRNNKKLKKSNNNITNYFGFHSSSF